MRFLVTSDWFEQKPIVIKQVASFKLSLLLKNYLQRTQTFQLILIGNYLQKVIRAKRRSLGLHRLRV